MLLFWYLQYLTLHKVAIRFFHTWVYWADMRTFCTISISSFSLKFALHHSSWYNFYIVKEIIIWFFSSYYLNCNLFYNWWSGGTIGWYNVILLLYVCKFVDYFSNPMLSWCWISHIVTMLQLGCLRVPVINTV